MRILYFVFCLCLSGFAHATPASLRLVMTVDWEGDHLRPENLRAFQKIREEYPEVPLLHYMNAAYFTKPGADKAALRKAIAAVLRPGDQFGVHIHGWKSLFTAAGVTHRVKPSWERYGRPGSTKNCSYDCGSEVPITAYTEAELQKVLSYSRTVLREQGFTGLRHFRAGGWVTSPALLAALAAEGFATDSSAIPVPLVADEIVGMDLLTLLHAYWPRVTSASQPYAVKTPRGELWEVPDNAALADYMRTGESLQIVTDALKDLHGTHYVIAGFHQETADDWMDRVQGFLKGVQKLIKEQKAPIVFSIMPETFP